MSSKLSRTSRRRRPASAIRARASGDRFLPVLAAEILRLISSFIFRPRIASDIFERVSSDAGGRRRCASRIFSRVDSVCLRPGSRSHEPRGLGTNSPPWGKLALDANDTPVRVRKVPGRMGHTGQPEMRDLKRRQQRGRQRAHGGALHDTAHERAPDASEQSGGVPEPAMTVAEVFDPLLHCGGQDRLTVFADPALDYLLFEDLFPRADRRSCHVFDRCDRLDAGR